MVANLFRPLLRFDVAPHRLSGVVVGALLNDPAELAALGDAVHQPPYKAPPQAPVLVVRPRNTFAGEGDTIAVPAGGATVGVTLGIVIGGMACRVEARVAMGHVAGWVVVADLSLPLASHYRPAARFKARDGFCPIGAHVVSRSALPNADALAMTVTIDGRVAQVTTTAGRIRGVSQLIADVSEFMTLRDGDLLLLGASHGAPLAQAGQHVALGIERVGSLSFSLGAEEGAA